MLVYSGSVGFRVARTVDILFCLEKKTMGFLRILITVNPVLRGHLWDKENVAL